jgi:hypothetical protein
VVPAQINIRIRNADTYLRRHRQNRKSMIFSAFQQFA